MQNHYWKASVLEVQLWEW